MKIKGINWFEANVEKIVLGVTATILVGVGVMQVVYQPNKVTVGGKIKNPEEAMEPVERLAEDARVAMDSTKPPTPPTVQLDIGTKFSQGLAAGVSPHNSIASLGPGSGLTAEGGGTKTEFLYAEIPVPAPTEPSAAFFRGTIDPREQVRNVELAKLLPTQQPFDKGSVSVEAVFSGSALRDALLAEAAPPMNPIPRQWWQDNGQDRVEIIGVELERETVVPAEGSKDTAGTKTMISSMPGRASQLAQWETTVKALGDVSPMLDMVHASAAEIERPKYYTMIEGPAWVEPSEMFASQDQEIKQQKITKLKKDHDEYQKQIEDTQRQVDQAPDSKKIPAPKVPGGGETGGGGARGGGVKGGAGGVGDPRGQPAPKAPDRGMLESKLKQLKSKLARIDKQLSDLGEKVVAPGAAPVVASNASLLETPEVKVWAHDVTAAPGATYRYKVRVVLNNPIFGRTLQDSQKKLGESSLMRSPWSEATADVSVDRSEYYFITSAAPGDRQNPTPRATAELYTYYYGYWRRASVSLVPGDTLEGRAKVPELPIFDVTKLAAAEQPDQNQPGAAPPPPVAPGGKGRPTGQPGRDQERGGQQPQPPAAGVQAALNVAGKPGPTEIPLNVDAIFLDVAKVASAAPGALAGSSERFEAVLRSVSGDLVFKSPEGDRGQNLYKRLEASAKAGLGQGKPEVKPEEKPAGSPTQPGKVQPPKSAPPGSGGGGGG